MFRNARTRFISPKSASYSRPTDRPKTAVVRTPRGRDDHGPLRSLHAQSTKSSSIYVSLSRGPQVANLRVYTLVVPRSSERGYLLLYCLFYCTPAWLWYPPPLPFSPTSIYFRRSEQPGVKANRAVLYSSAVRGRLLYRRRLGAIGERLARITRLVGAVLRQQRVYRQVLAV